MPEFTFTKPTGETYTITAPDQQQAISAWTRMQGQGPVQQQAQPQNQWDTRTLLPYETNQAGSVRPAVPKILQSIFGGMTLPGDVAQQNTQTFNPGGSVRDIPDKDYERLLGLSAVANPAALTGITPAKAIVQQMTVPERSAINTFAKSAARDQVPLSQVQNRVNAIGPNTRLADIGQNTQQLAAAVSRQPGNAMNTMRNMSEQRAANVGPRIQQDVQGAFGTGNPKTVMLNDLAKAQQEAATPLYDAVREVMITPSADIRFVLSTKYGKEAITKARDMAYARGQIFEDSQGRMSVGGLDLVKRALDDMVTSTSHFSSPSRNYADIVSGLSKRLRGAIDDQVDGYKTARNVFAGHAQVQDAMNLGADIFQKSSDPATFTRLVKAMTDSEREALINGARTAVEDVIGSATNDKTMIRNILAKPFNRAKLTLVIGKEAVDDLLAGIGREIVFGATDSGIARATLSEARRAAVADIAPGTYQPPSIPRPGVSILNIIPRAFNGAINKIRGPAIKRANEELAKLLEAQTINPRVLEAARRWQTPTQSPWLTTVLTKADLAAAANGGR